MLRVGEASRREGVLGGSLFHYCSKLKSRIKINLHIWDAPLTFTDKKSIVLAETIKIIKILHPAVCFLSEIQNAGLKIIKSF